jgi:hypothetical protein
MRPTLWSGCQSGADRAALDFARAVGIPYGGWIPKGRRAEDGLISPEYLLTETQTSDYRERTELNVEGSDGTVIFTDGPLTEESGSWLTVKFCRKYKRPHLAVDLSKASPEDAAKFLRAFVRDGKIGILNVAGSRASKAPKIYDKVMQVLKLAFLEE